MTSRFEFYQRSENNLQGVKPQLVAVAQRALELSPVDFAITEGLRTQERQKKLYAEGKSQTMNSRHLTGDAIDVVAYVGCKISRDFPVYRKIADAFKKAAQELRTLIEWGVTGKL